MELKWQAITNLDKNDYNVMVGKEVSSVEKREGRELVSTYTPSFFIPQVHIQAHLGDNVGLVLEYCNKANIQ